MSMNMFRSHSRKDLVFRVVRRADGTDLADSVMFIRCSKPDADPMEGHIFVVGWISTPSGGSLQNFRRFPVLAPTINFVDRSAQ